MEQKTVSFELRVLGNLIRRQAANPKSGGTSTT